jgi:hypothetical protein
VSRSIGSQPSGRSVWATRLALLACLVAFVGLPVLLFRLEGGLPSLPRLTTWSAVRAFLRSNDDTALTNAIVRNGERVVWTLWAYLLLTILGEAAGRALERLGRPSFRAAWERIQPRSAMAVANLVMTLALAGAPRVGRGIAVAAVPAEASSPRSPGPAGAGTLPMPAGAHELIAFREDGGSGSAPRQHVVQHGETLWGIARLECATPLYWRQIADINAIDDPARVVPGLTLELPSACQASYVSYVVEPGDSLARIAQREYGTATAATVIWESNRDVVMSDGRRFSNPDLIYPDWTLRLPTSVLGLDTAAVPPSALQAAPPTTMTDPSARAEPLAPDPVRPPVAAAAPPVSASSPAATPDDPGAGHGARSVEGPLRPRPAPQPSRGTTGVRIPGGLLPYGMASGLAAVVYLARLRRRSRRRLSDPERRRQDGPVVGALRGTPPIMDAITPHTLALLEVLQAGGADCLPRVLGAWEAEQYVAFLLDTEAASLPAGGTNRAGTFSVVVGVRDGAVVAVTEALKDPEVCLRREVVPFVDEILIPIGGRDAEGWLHLPLLGEPISVVGKGSRTAAWAMLMAAALRSGGTDLRVMVAPGVLGDARLPNGLDLPRLETLSKDELTNLPLILGQEAERRRRAIAGEGFDTFAELQTLWPSLLSAWVLVLDPTAAEGCAAELAELAPLGVGALVLGDSAVASRRVSLDAGLVAVSAPGVGTFEGLIPVGLGEQIVEELEAESQAAEPEGVSSAEPHRAEAADGERGARPADPLPRLRLYLLGGFQATLDGEEVAMSGTTSALARELAARLAVAYPAPVPARELRADLWPDDLDPEVNKVQPLYQLVSRARVWLGWGDKDNPIIEHLPGRTRQEGGSYRLREAWVDLLAFRKAAAGETPEALQEALELYSGDLLAGQESDSHFRWAVADGYRDEERFRFFGVVARLAEFLLGQGDPDRALSVLDRAFATRDGTAVEELGCLAMRCEAARGSADGVRRRYSRLCAALEQDEASAKTVELLKQLLVSLELRVPRSRTPAGARTGLRVVVTQDQASAQSNNG